MKVLIAEDDLTSRLMLEGVLKKWGYDVLSVSDGNAAWAAVQRERDLHVAILDWIMPNMDGLAVCRRIKALERPVPIYTMLLTGRDSTEDIVQGFDSGADDYVTKPFENNELRARIRVAERMVRIQGSLSDKVRELKVALAHVKMLQGIIPICMHCHKIRSDDKAWEKLEAYIENHSEAEFSHSICPDCLAQHYPDLDLDEPDE